MSGILETIVRDFVAAFNAADLDSVMRFFAEDAVYDELTGTRHAGRSAVRKAFEPQFRGDFGALIFDEEDLFVEEDTGKALVSWTCRMGDGSVSWRGLDVLVFRGGLVSSKSTYTKAKGPKLEKA